MKSVKWLYVTALAIALGMLSFGTVACHDDDDDPKPEEGEVVETPKPVVEYYIMGTVTSKGTGKSGVKVKVGDKDCTTDSEGKFSVTESNTGTYEVSVAPAGYLSQKTSVKIADNAENRSVVTVAFALTEESPKEVVKLDATEKTTVEDKSESNVDLPKPEEVKPEEVVEDRPLAKVEIEIPVGAIEEAGQKPGIVDNGKVDISVTTFVPAPKEVVTEVKPTEEIKTVENIPLAAAHFEPTGLKFKEAVTISIPNPIPGITFPNESMRLTYLNPETGEWEKQTADVTLENDDYKAPVTHFSAYAIENEINSTVSKEVVLKDEVLGQASRDNSENPKAVTGIVLKYTEKAGWDYVGDIAQAIKNALGTGVTDATVNAMAAYLKTRMYSLMGSTSGITTTERTYNTVNVNGYTEMNYACYAKTRTTTLTTKVIYDGQQKTISISAKRYTGADQQYKTVTYNPTHSGGKGGSI
ncbi:carboxypeptidase regulatory-like domain-containing protein [uncultured Bacteroides sp.]|uniref:carboxypeptidase regulatory-like domain-containing protein n=1 Tax=uncultured Bacteroides sp. TaxID=162156 RepID=UPI0025D9DD56|nr:carboxypeptidase regulatory-like domain-containing protein [uncultured Bacteroides sp.]